MWATSCCELLRNILCWCSLTLPAAASMVTLGVYFLCERGCGLNTLVLVSRPKMVTFLRFWSFSWSPGFDFDLSLSLAFGLGWISWSWCGTSSRSSFNLAAHWLNCWVILFLYVNLMKVLFRSGNVDLGLDLVLILWFWSRSRTHWSWFWDFRLGLNPSLQVLVSFTSLCVSERPPTMNCWLSSHVSPCFIWHHWCTTFLSCGPHNVVLKWLLTVYGTEWPILCWCAIKKLLTHLKWPWVKYCYR